MVQKNSKSEEENKNLLSTHKSSQNDSSVIKDKNMNVKKVNDQPVDSSKTNNTKAFESVEEIILKLTDKIIAEKTIKNEKNKLINSSKESDINVAPKRKPVSVYLAPIDDIKPTLNVKDTYANETLNQNALNRDINLYNGNNCASIEKSQSYENLNLGTPKGKKKTIFVPINNGSYNLDVTPPSVISSDNVNEKSSKHKTNLSMFTNTSIPQLATKKKSQRHIFEDQLQVCSKVSTPINQRSLTSVSGNSTLTAIEILKSKQKSCKCKHVTSENMKIIDKSFEKVYENNCKTCSQCSSSKKRDTRKDRKNQKLNQKNSTLEASRNNSMPRTSMCSTASSFANTQNLSQNIENKSQSNENVYTLAPSRNRNRFIDIDSGIDNPLFNDDVSMFPYTCKVTNTPSNFVPCTNILYQNDNKKIMPLKSDMVELCYTNISEKNKKPVIKVESPKIPRFYDMQIHNNEKKNYQKHDQNNLKKMNGKFFNMNEMVNNKVVKTAESLSTLKDKRTLLKTTKSNTGPSSLKTISTASNGQINNCLQSTKKSSDFDFNTAVANESEDIITDSFVPYNLRGSSNNQIITNQYINENISKECKNVNETKSNEILVVLDDDKGNKVTVNMTNIIKSISSNNEALSPQAIFINGSQIWKKL
ncbi:Hypothetical protein SRAE_2000112500 [Strongyloides ratti]|uniref:Uncharacterized protein n=1 Tax=Strongyloides ratti TaxID=34506 RepID=A0A090L9M7_STRRB|nr:Hypothetical protein SRAE_2000112500 [Strongyloides ratti]CEF66457.1 Hypothetical protein SRAE_2000112500 [Strongyloides ratti]